MKKVILISIVGLGLLTSCKENKVYNVESIMYRAEVVISDEDLVKGDTVRIGYDLGGREIASKDMSGYYIGHTAIVQ